MQCALQLCKHDSVRGKNKGNQSAEALRLHYFKVRNTNRKRATTGQIILCACPSAICERLVCTRSATTRTRLAANQWLGTALGTAGALPDSPQARVGLKELAPTLGLAY